MNNEKISYIETEVEALTGLRVKKAALNRAWVLDQLLENVQRAMRATAPVNDAGEPCGEYRYEGGVANRALELIGKELGMFKDRISQEVTGGRTLEVVFVKSGERSGEEGGRGQ
jgi:hypothetical protein